MLEHIFQRFEQQRQVRFGKPRPLHATLFLAPRKRRRNESMGPIKPVRNGRLAAHRAIVSALFLRLGFRRHRHARDGMLERHNRLHRSAERQLHRPAHLTCIGPRRHDRAKRSDVVIRVAHVCACLVDIIAAGLFRVFFLAFRFAARAFAVAFDRRVRLFDQQVEHRFFANEDPVARLSRPRELHVVAHFALQTHVRDQTVTRLRIDARQVARVGISSAFDLLTPATWADKRRVANVVAINTPFMNSSPPNAKTSPDLIIFSWNLNHEVQALKLALKQLESYASLGHPCVAVFQETPSSVRKEVASISKLWMFSNSGKPLRTKNAIIMTTDLEVDPNGDTHDSTSPYDTNGRCLGITLRSTHWTGLRFLAVHGLDRRSHPTPEQRADWAGIVRTILSSFWKTGPLIVAGDLNANPWDFEVTRRNGWFAWRRRDIWPAKPKTSKVANIATKASPLLNLTWGLVTSHRGTYFYCDANDLRWHFVDQFLATEDLLAEGQLVPHILTKIADTSLCDNNGQPLRTVEGGDDCEDSAGDDNNSKAPPEYEYSDHLPIELRIPVDTLIKSCNSQLQGRMS